MSYRFGDFTLDLEASCLLGPEGEVRLRPQAFRMLEVLVESAPRILSQEALLDQVWGVEHLSPASGPASRRPAWRRRLVPVALLFPLLAGVAVVALLGWPLPGRNARPKTTAAPAATAPSGRPAVAILGFRNLSARPKDAWISSALGEILGFELIAPGRLRVLAAENVARMQRELDLGGDEVAPESLARIGRHLGTNLVITGSYLVSRTEQTGATIRIQMTVQDVRTGETIAWARESGAREELLELATAAAHGILGSLGEGPGTAPPEAAALAANAESLRLWSEAMSLLRVRSSMAAVPLLQKAEEIDPDNPFVHDALAMAWSRLGFDGRAADAAGQALALAKHLPEEIRLGLEARAHHVRLEPVEAARSYAELWRLFPDNLDYGLALAAGQIESGAVEASFLTLEALRKLPSPDGEDPRIDLTASDAAWWLGDFARCRDAARQGIEKAEARGATVLVAAGRVSRGWALLRLGQSDAALADFRAAGAIYQDIGDRGAAAGARTAEASIHTSRNRPAEARRIYEEVIPVFREIGDRTREAKALNNFAALVGGTGDLGKAAELLERSLAIKREIQDLQGMALTLANLGNLRLARGDPRSARPYLEEAIGISRRLGDAHGTALALRGIARVEARESRFAAGRAALEEAIGLSRQNGDAEGLAQAELALADLEEKAGRLEEARGHYETSLALWTELKDQETAAEVRAALAKLGKLGAASGTEH